MTRVLGVALLLAACGAPARPPALRSELARAAAEGQALFDAGELTRARARLSHALDRARLMDDPLELGNCSYNLALVEAERGDSAAARSLLAEAAAALRRAGEPSLDVQVLGVRLDLRDGEVNRAQVALAAIEDRDAARLPLAMLRTELALARGDANAAEQALAEVTALAPSADAPERRELFARLTLLRGDAAGAAQTFDALAQSLRDAQRFRRMAGALADAGAAYAAAKQWATAADRTLRAAQSRLAANDLSRARVLVATALQRAQTAGDPQLQARAQSLARELPPEPAR